MNSFDSSKRQTLKWGVAIAGGSVLAACGDSGGGGAYNTAGVAGVLYAMTNEAAGNKIVRMTRDANTGVLTMVDATPTTGAGGTIRPGAAAAQANPLASQNSLRMAANDTLLLAVNAGDNSVSVFSVAAGTGALTLKMKNSLGADGEYPNSLDYHPSGYVYVTFGKVGASATTANANHLAAYSLNASTGAMTRLSAHHLDDAAKPTQVSVDPSGKFVIVNPDSASGGVSKIFTLSIGASGALTDSTAAQILTVTSFGPYAGSFYKAWSGANRYLLTSTVNTSVVSYSINATTGALKQANTVVAGQGGACWSVMTPNQNYLFIGNGSGSISSFSINSEGTHSLLNSIAADDVGVGGDMWVSGDSKYLYVNDLGGSVIKAYAISSSGHLTKIGSDITMPTTPVTGTPTTQGLAGF